MIFALYADYAPNCVPANSCSSLIGLRHSAVFIPLLHPSSLVLCLSPFSLISHFLCPSREYSVWRESALFHSQVSSWKSARRQLGDRGANRSLETPTEFPLCALSISHALSSSILSNSLPNQSISPLAHPSVSSSVISSITISLSFVLTYLLKMSSVDFATSAHLSMSWEKNISSLFRMEERKLLVEQECQQRQNNSREECTWKWLRVEQTNQWWREKQR